MYLLQVVMGPVPQTGTLVTVTISAEPHGVESNGSRVVETFSNKRRVSWFSLFGHKISEAIAVGEQ